MKTLLLLLLVESQEPENFHKGVINGFKKQKDLDLIILHCPRDVKYAHGIYDEQIEHIVKKHDIDIFFAIQGEQVSKNTIKELNRHGIKTVVWNVDDPYILTHASNRNIHKRRVNEYQFIYTSNLKSITKYYPAITRKEVKFLPFGFDPVYHKNLRWKKEYPVSFVGSAFDNRLKNYINPLLGNIKLFGLTRASRVNHKRMIEIANQSYINLNFSDQPSNGVKCLKNRVPEIMGSGQFLLSEDFPEADKLFEVDKEIVLFSSLPELKDKIKFYLVNGRERQKIARAGYKKVKAEYSYEKLLKGVLEDIA